MIPGLYFEEILIHKLLARPSDFRAVFRASPDAMLLVGADGLLKDANPEAETMFGWSREEMVGESVELLVPPELRDRHRRHREVYHRKPASRPMGVGMELEAVHKDGGGFPVEISLGPMTDETGEVLVVCAVRSLAQSQMLRRVAAARVLAAEAERSRIARDLHDEVKQSLTAAQLHLAALVERGMVGEDAPEMISGVQGDLDRCHDALDRAIRDLMPVELEGHGLEFALSVLCRRTEEQGFAVERDIRLAGRALRAETSLAVFRVVQEALNNARRHSGAGSARVRYWREGGTLYAEISDSGAGFSPDELEPHLSVGLGSMRERSRIAGGRLTIASAPGDGTSVMLEVPIGMPVHEEDDPE